MFPYFIFLTICLLALVITTIPRSRIFILKGAQDSVVKAEMIAFVEFCNIISVVKKILEDTQMLIGVFLRHYKIYRGLYFIPINSDYNNKYSVYIGNNGAGKSSILESLNTFFNGANWNRNKDGKKDDAFIAPIFLVRKEEFINTLELGDEDILYFEFLSDYFWSSNTELGSNFSTDEFKKFYQYRDILKNKYDKEEYFLFLVGIAFNNKNDAYFITFNDSLLKKVPLDLKDYKYQKILDLVKEYYTYVYIPIEASPSDILKIENREMQELMNRDILNEIDNILNQKNIKNGSRGHYSVIEFLNNSLNTYMDSINDIISKIDERYAYKVEGMYKKNLKSSDVRKKILEAYFSIRTLKKDRKEVSELSSGEQRTALLDVATAFLIESSSAHKNVILAVDEPENSLHISRAFSQFERLRNLSTKNQILITTHWYGSLPVTDTGDLHYIELISDKKVEMHSFKLNNYFEKRGKLPDDIIIKSYFELSSSILSSMRSEEKNWIICEGTDDKIYLEYYLRNVPNLQVFAVGGCANVVKMYNYLYLPFCEREENRAINSKLLCLVDTDEHLNIIDFNSSTKGEKLKIARIQMSDDDVLLSKLSSGGIYTPTEIEDCLDPELLYDSLVQCISKYGDSVQRDSIAMFSFKQDMKNSKIKGEQSILAPSSIEAIEHKEFIYQFIDDYRNKYLISELYVKNAMKRGHKMPSLFRRIEQFFDVI